MSEPIGQILPGTHFGELLTALAIMSKTIVEIGTWRGGGSTQCFVNGLIHPDQRFYAIEADHAMLTEAMSRHKDPRITWLLGTVSPMNDAPIVLEQLPAQIDLLLIDGGEGNGTADLDALIRHADVRIVALDDTMTDKNRKNRLLLIASGWKTLADEPNDRNGWAMFEKPILAEV